MSHIGSTRLQLFYAFVLSRLSLYAHDENDEEYIADAFNIVLVADGSRPAMLLQADESKNGEITTQKRADSLHKLFKKFKDLNLMIVEDDRGDHIIYRKGNPVKTLSSRHIGQTLGYVCADGEEKGKLQGHPTHALFEVNGQILMFNSCPGRLTARLRSQLTKRNHAIQATTEKLTPDYKMMLLTGAQVDAWMKHRK